jgi:serine/threonine-protein kinase
VTDISDRLTAALADRYTIERELGAGGMATVYLAHDVKHDRKVAVKALRPELAAVLGPERFLNEIKVTANLQHPHILPLHDSGEADNFLYYVMPYVEGESLREKLNREKQLSIEESIEITKSVASALDYAHRQNVIHRDIKPENILLYDGQPVVADFGIALAVTAAGGTRLTETGLSLGTPQYMSPEQATGDREIDGRSDIYSLACVLYEMLAGDPPHTGSTVQAIVAKVLTDRPRPVRELRDTVPVYVEATLDKALAKLPADRFDSAAQFAEALGAAQVGMMAPTVTPAKPRVPVRLLTALGFIVIMVGAALISWSLLWPPETAISERLPVLAVLPPENLGSPEDETLAEGLALEVQSRLMGLSGLSVIGYGGVRHYQDTEGSSRQIGRQSGADYLLRMTAQWQRRDGEVAQVRVNAALIDAVNGTHLWSDSYSNDLSDVFTVQSNVAQQVVDALGVTLLQSELAMFEQRPTDNPVAYQYYLRGNAYFDRQVVEKDAQLAVQMYARALELDPNFAVAYAALSRAYVWLFFLWDWNPEQITNGKDAVDMALRLDPDLPEAHVALGDLHYYGSLDYEKALEEYAIAQRQRPNDAVLGASIGYIRRRQGEWEAAAASIKAAVDVAARYRTHIADLAETYLLMRWYREAERYLDRAISLTPDIPGVHQDKALLYLLWEGNKDRAWQVLREAPEGTVDTWHSFNVAPRIIGRVFAAGYADMLPRQPRVTDTVTVSLVEAAVAAQSNRADLASALYEKAYIILKRGVDTTWDAAPAYALPFQLANLGIAAAGTGRVDEAINSGERAVEMLPVSRDAFTGPDLVACLVEIYIMVGHYDQAIQRIEYLLSIPSLTSRALLAVDPLYGPLHDDSRFQRLLAGGN